MQRYPSEYPYIYNALGEPEGVVTEAENALIGSGRPRKRARAEELDEPTVVCGVCFDEIRPDHIPQVRCGHSFCRDCWSQYLSTKVRDEGTCWIRCMDTNCKATLPKSFIEHITDAGLLERRDRNTPR